MKKEGLMGRFPYSVRSEVTASFFPRHARTLLGDVGSRDRNTSNFWDLEKQFHIVRPPELLGCHHAPLLCKVGKHMEEPEGTSVMLPTGHYGPWLFLSPVLSFSL